MKEGYFVLWLPGLVFPLVLEPNFYVYTNFKIRSSKLIRIVSKTDKNIKKCPRVYILAVNDNFISQMDQFKLKKFFAGGGALFLWK